MTLIAKKNGHTNPSTRLPGALINRFWAGDTIADLAADYEIPVEQVEWGLELAAWRMAVAGLPAAQRQKAIGKCEAALDGTGRSFVALAGKS